MNPILRAFLLLVPFSLLATAGCTPRPPGSVPPPTSGGKASVPPASGLAISDQPRDLSPAVGSEEVTELAAANAAFAFDLYRALRGAEGNLFFSPYSISVALAMTYAGAAGNTADQMASSMHFTLPRDRLHPAFNAYALDLQNRAEAETEGTAFELSVANSLWGQQDFPFRREFLDLLAEHYGAGMRLVDFAADPEAARLAINGWVSDETRDKILDLIPSGAIDPLTRLVLANAIYFQAGWLHPFEAEATTTEPFHLLDGTTVDAPLMHQDRAYGRSVRDGYRAVELPYASGNMSMLILLPDEGEFRSVEEALGPEMVQQLVDELTFGPVILSLPRFSYDSDFSLEAALRNLGMTDAFDPGSADFSGMDGRRDLFIGSILHKAFVSVDEHGTEAAAATAVIMELTSAYLDEPIVFTVDRPFLFLIRDRETGSILFLGRVLDPRG